MAVKKLVDKSILLEMPDKKTEQPATSFSSFDKDKTNFHKMDHIEPHSVRREQILTKYPEIKKLFKKEPKTILWVFYIHLIQFYMCYMIYYYNFDWNKIPFLAYGIGAALNHGLFVLIHDITHFNVSKSEKNNKLLAIFANLPQIIPSAIGFGRYHKDHHSFMGDQIHDPDIPTMWEIQFFNTFYKKLIYMLFMPLFYGLRPYFKAPKKPSNFEILNSISCFIYGFSIGYFLGMKAFIYLLLSTYFGLSIHPTSAHVLAEHYEFVKGQDTYSYYGWINYFNFNMGYHVEHHDFPNIPWNKLPEVRKIAPDFYENLPVIDSYFVVMYKYIFDSETGPWSRVTINSYENIMGTETHKEE
jgi:sphingolipid delta-4 desaturase